MNGISLTDISNESMVLLRIPIHRICRNTDLLLSRFRRTFDSAAHLSDIRPCWRHSSSLAGDSFGPPPSHPQRRVVVTGLGLVTPLGIGVGEVWKNLLAGSTAVRALEVEDLFSSSSSLWKKDKGIPSVIFSQLPSKVIARVPKAEFETSPWFPKDADPRRVAPFMSFAMAAASEALEDARWHPSTERERRETGVAIGVGMSATEEMAEAGTMLQEGKLRRISPFFVPRVLVNMPAGAISIKFGLQGPNHAASTACASGAHAIGDAFRIVQRGEAEIMLAGGTESCIDAISLGGFSRLKALSTSYNDRPGEASRPFDRDRDGFVMGEGAGVLVLESLEHATDRGARMYAEVRGYGLSADAYHVTQPPQDGAGARLAMTRALTSAGLSPLDIGYVNAHATSTPIGDDIEQRAIAAVFGEATSGLLVSSTKGAVGHLLGAAGAVEAAFAILASWYGEAPPTVNLKNPEPHVLPGLIGTSSVVLDVDRPAVLTNSFGFGGTNASLVFGPSPVRE